MKILQIVTLITPDNAYGGPLRVAINQARQLISMGHDVTVFVGSSGYSASPPHEVDGVPVRAFPAHRTIPFIGFAGMSSPRLCLHVAKVASEFDVIHVHLARDLIVAPAAMIALLRRASLVLQTHGMIDASERKLAGLFDRLQIKRLIAESKAVLWLTEEERESLTALFGHQFHSQQLINGVPVLERDALENRPFDRKSEAKSIEVLFLARLHKRKRPADFVRAARNLIERGVTAKFKLIGPDEGEASTVLALADPVGEQIEWIGGKSPEDTLAIMALSDVYCLPSINEPFPMSVLEALSCGLPSIVTESCGLAPYIQSAKAGVVVDPSDPSQLEEALARLIGDESLRQDMSKNARRLASSVFSMSQVGAQLEAIYSRALR